MHMVSIARPKDALHNALRCGAAACCSAAAALQIWESRDFGTYFLDFEAI